MIIQKGLIYWSDMGYNAGITAHYTTNGIYLSIASIFFLFSYFYDIIVISDARLIDEIEYIKQKYTD